MREGAAPEGLPGGLIRAPLRTSVAHDQVHLAPWESVSPGVGAPSWANTDLLLSPAPDGRRTSPVRCYEIPAAAVLVPDPSQPAHRVCSRTTPTSSGSTTKPAFSHRL